MGDKRYESPLRQPPFNYPFPPLTSILHISWPRGSKQRRDAAIVSLARLVGYMLERVGFPLEAYEAYWNEEPFPDDFVVVVRDRERLLDNLDNAWYWLTGPEPGESIGALHGVVVQLGAAVPRWWLEEVDFVPDIEGGDSKFSVGWWEQDGIPIIEDELPPWEDTQASG